MRRASALALLSLGLVVSACQSGSMFKTRADLVATPNTCAAKRFEIYFSDGQAGLTPSARQAIDLTAKQLDGCTIKAVKVLGLADAKGDAAVNDALSRQRAETVARALSRSGWPTPAFELEAAGETGAIAAPGVSEPLRRRTEVLVDAAPK